LPLAVLHCLPQFHISGRLLDLCAGGLSPGRIQLGNPCSSAHLARGPPNRRDGRAIAASISTINPRVRHEQDKRRGGSTFCAGYSPFPQDYHNAVSRLAAIRRSARSCGLSIEPWHHKASARSRLLVAGQPTSECLGRLTSGPTTDRSSSPTPCHEWIAVVGVSGAVQPKTNIPPGPPSGGLSAEQRYFYLIGATLRGILGQERYQAVGGNPSVLPRGGRRL
jgi:hypothetical protein